MIRIFHSLFCCLIACNLNAQLTSDSSVLLNIIQENKSLDRIFSNDDYKVQIRYTEVNGGELEPPVSLGRETFFYPASTVKIPVAILTLVKMNELGITLTDRLILRDSLGCGNDAYVKKCNRDSISFYTLLTEMLVISDNEAYSALYHFLTPEYISVNLEKRGFNSSRIFKSFSTCSLLELCTNPFIILDSSGFQKYSASSACWNISRERIYCEGYSREKVLGTKHEIDGKIIEGPYDFNFGIELDLIDLDEMFKRLIYPEHYNQEDQWGVSSEQRTLLMSWLSMFPRELNSPHYRNSISYPDHKFKFSMSAGSEPHSDITIYSKLGLSYGFTTEVCYIQLKDQDKGFFLMVSMYTNKNGVLNDGKYEYEEIARPFISELVTLLVKEL